ncbi:hypothetical protein KHAB170019_11960 [Acinetobacter baumannii]|uniref:hypothetical protein n=1 Tax=Acinetobacter baumannii TaxID=470 RepID=UPI00194F173E|nr:hypothetical protein [Acinetobacter baumannii]BCR40373.1 hypothetical protein KHAB170019_11960 [Acinetobacter baumannii]
MVKHVDYEAVYDGENFSFIKVLMDDGSYDPIAGTNGPYGIITIVGYEKDCTLKKISAPIYKKRKKTNHRKKLMV